MESRRPQKFSNKLVVPQRITKIVANIKETFQDPYKGKLINKSNMKKKGWIEPEDLQIRSEDVFYDESPLEEVQMRIHLII
jgi:hypothetical protein